MFHFCFSGESNESFLVSSYLPRAHHPGFVNYTIFLFFSWLLQRFTTYNIKLLFKVNENLYPSPRRYTDLRRHPVYSFSSWFTCLIDWDFRCQSVQIKKTLWSLLRGAFSVTDVHWNLLTHLPPVLSFLAVLFRSFFWSHIPSVWSMFLRIPFHEDLLGRENGPDQLCSCPEGFRLHTGKGFCRTPISLLLRAFCF